ncbi:interleukin-8-like [Ambystoma mexicanum]|uniref:interleukin-8-like n=1 Tax=Ambystoma mexicanum TaxID=8296 RepID=UPI0037E9BC86
MEGRLCVVLCACLLCAAAAEGMTLQRSARELRCQCPNTEPAFIHPKQYGKVELIPSGAHCENFEVIIHLKSGEKVCVDTKEPWVQKIVDWFSQSAAPGNK